MSRYMMHDTYGTRNLRCPGMAERPRIRAVTIADAHERFSAHPCYVCMPFDIGRRGVVVVERRET